MPTEIQSLTAQEHKAVLSVCIMAAFADGLQADAERAQIERIVNGFAEDHLDVPAAYQDVLSGKVSLAQVAPQLQTPSAKGLAYEMAVCVCQVDGVLSDGEKQFLANLRQALQLDSAAMDVHQQSAQALVTQPLSALPPIIKGPQAPDVDAQILRAAILSGALEIMPHTLATMAIVPLQMRLVYQIGKEYGYSLDAGHVKDFLATVGIGLSSQVFEGFTRRLIGSLARGVGGRLVGGVVGEAAGSAVAFATTYAMGQVAKRYYSSGRTLTPGQLKESFTSMLQDARSMQTRYSGEIAQQARTVQLSELLPLVKG